MSLSDPDLLELHRRLVGIRSVSHQEEPVRDFLAGYLEERGVRVEVLGRNVFARAGSGPRLLLNSHYDTVPPGPEWTRDPWEVTVEEGRVHGLGANDAKASVAAMVAAFLDVASRGGPCEVGLLIACEEETGGEGTEWAWPRIQDAGFVPEAVVVGEPTALDVATSQKGLLILELETHGSGGHAAHAAATGSTSAVKALARDLVAIDGLVIGEAHPQLGSNSIEPTVLSGGEAKNKVAERARCVLDVRTVPGLTHDELIAAIESHVAGALKVHSQRLEPFGCAPEATVVRAARRARPVAQLFGSRTMSDLVFFRGLEGIKVGPGRTERSHQPDEFVYESEVLEGAAFYRNLIAAYPEERSRT